MIGKIIFLCHTFERREVFPRVKRTFAIHFTFIAVALAITGILNPVVGALIHNAGSVLVILNSFSISSL